MQLQQNTSARTSSSRRHQHVSSPTVNHVYRPLKRSVAASFPQAHVLQLSSQPSVGTRLLSVMLRELLSYPPILPPGMLPNATILLAKSAASSNAPRILLYSVPLSRASCQEQQNSLSLAELLGSPFRLNVPTYGELMPISPKAHAPPRSCQALKMSNVTIMLLPLLPMAYSW